MREIPHSIATIESQHGLNEGSVGEVVKGVVVVLGNAVDYFSLVCTGFTSTPAFLLTVGTYWSPASWMPTTAFSPWGSDWVNQNLMLIGTCSFASFTKLVFTPLLT